MISGWSMMAFPWKSNSRTSVATSVPTDRYSYEQVELLRDFVRALQHPRGGDGQPLAVEF